MTGRGTVAAADWRAALRVVIAALGFAFISIFTVIATRDGTPLTMVLLGRYVVATITLLPAVRAWPPAGVDGGRLLRVFVVGGIGQGLVAVLSLSALAYIPAATLVFLFYSFPAWVTLVAVARGIERVDRRKGAALGLASLGLGLLVGLPGSESLHPTGVLLALVAAVVYAVFIPVIAHLQRGLAPGLSTLLVTSCLCVIFGLAAPLRGEFSLQLTPGAWGAIVGMGVFCTALSLQLFFSGLASLGPVRTSILCTVEPLYTALLAALLLDQPVTVPVLAGGACILGAVVTLQRGPGTGAG